MLPATVYDAMTAVLIDPNHFGVSFSLKQCHALGLNPQKTLNWLIKEAGFRRFRLMSYWNEHEKKPGQYSFDELTWQIKKIEQAGGVITLCLGVRQPRWPENHWPEWVWKLPPAERTQVLLEFLKQVVGRYKHESPLISYQLENEALLASFGERSDINRYRLVQEFELIKNLDPDRPIIMTTSNHWGIPMRRPTPDIIGFSYYHVVYDQGYTSAHHYAWMHRIRKWLVKLLKNRPAFIHELQLEPWGPTAIGKMDIAEQNKSMGIDRIRRNVRLATRTTLWPIDLWGGEWWYWRLTKHADPTIWRAVAQALDQSQTKREAGDA